MSRSLLVVVLLALLAPACRDQERQLPPERANFTVVEVAVTGRQTVNPARGEELKQQLLGLVNAYYDAGFVKLSAHRVRLQQVTPLFTSEAFPQLAKNASSLVLGPLSTKVARVTPLAQEVTKFSVYVADDNSVAGGLISTKFEALALMENANAVKVQHSATFWLTHDGTAFKFTMAQAELKLDSVPEIGR